MKFFILAILPVVSVLAQAELSIILQSKNLQGDCKIGDEKIDGNWARKCVQKPFGEGSVWEIYGCKQKDEQNVVKLGETGFVPLSDIGGIATRCSRHGFQYTYEYEACIGLADDGHKRVEVGQTVEFVKTGRDGKKYVITLQCNKNADGSIEIYHNNRPKE